MCKHAHPAHPGPSAHAARHGSSLAHGRAHSRDHLRWSRRDFLGSLGMAAAGAYVLGGTPVKAFGHATLARHLQRLDTDRVLVLLQLSGGNDGLNTVIPVNDDRYYNVRPTLAIPKSQTLALDGDLGLHPSLEALMPLWNEGKMALLQNVGYPEPDLSHFRSTDIWVSASDSETVVNNGWAGRYLNRAVPDFAENPPENPLAVQIGGGAPMLFQGPTSNMGMSLASVEIFERIAETGLVYDLGGLPETTFGEEMAYVRTVANDSFKYAGAIQAAADGVENSVAYPINNPLARDLAILARLIKGDLGGRIYAVSLASFDTHAGQAGTHALLLRYLAEALAAFYDDLAADNLNDRVLTMTFSEFGRRIQQNASEGTDHGTAAPLFLFGDGVAGGRFGTLPDLDNPDDVGSLRYEHDFRSVYATVLRDWLGTSEETTEEILGGAFETIPFVASPISVGTEGPPVAGLPEGFVLDQNYPNPFNPQTTIGYTLRHTTSVRLRVFDAQGRLVRTLLDRAQAAGTYAVAFDATALPSGTYFYRLETPDATQTRQMILIR